MKTHTAIGIMSGSSLDGLDIALCEFHYNKNWHYRILSAITHPFTEDWQIALKEAPSLNSEKLIELDMEFGKYIGNSVNTFMNSNNLKPDLICSHGHTVFHNPKKGYTLQIGNGQAISEITKIKTIYDFRTKDIILGGQGAPLVPIGDELLFPENTYCLNIGGIANISYKYQDKRIAFDICPANQLLNHLSIQLGSEMDFNGDFARLGKLNVELFNSLNKIEFYYIPYPKSISNQLVKEVFIPLIDKSKATIEDKLYTVCKHIAYQIKLNTEIKKGDILVTGGGAKNHFLTHAIEQETGYNIIIPDMLIVDFKEALIFAFMGVLKSLGELNCLSSATGATKDSSSGIIAT